MDDEQRRPILRIVRGDPTQEEIAALITVIAARARQRAAGRRHQELPRSAWTDRSRLVRQPVRPGLGAWRASAWPR